MNTPQDKATQLVNGYRQFCAGSVNRTNNFILAKQCVLITVDEILDVLFQHYKIDYWKEVKSEIEKL